MSAFPYVVKQAGRDHAAFVFADYAQAYVEMMSDPENRRAPRVDSARRGPDVLLYEREDYTIEEAASGRKVIGTTGHGHAILAALEKER